MYTAEEVTDARETDRLEALEDDTPAPLEHWSLEDFADLLSPHVH